MARSAFVRALGLAGVSALVAACGQEQAGPSEQPAISLLIVSGDGQSAVVGTELVNPLVIKATDSKGKPLIGMTVNFRVTGGGGSVFAGAAITDIKGVAEDYWTLGTSSVQSQTLEVRAVSSTGEKQVFGVFTANALAAAAAQVVVQAGDGQIALHGTSVPISPAVLITDQYGNPVPNHPVTFSLGLGGGSITGAATTTNANGIASVGSWTLGPTVCPNSLTATAAGGGINGNPVSFSATGGDCWTILPGMPTVRQNLAGGVVNGLVYAVGGFNVAPAATLEAFNPGTNSWAARVSMPTGRYGLSAGVVNSTLYAVGGSAVNNGPPLDVMEAYDPASNLWTTKAPMPTPRRFLAIGVVNGILYAVGGVDGAGATGTVEAYDPATNTWTAKAPMPTPRSQLAVGVV
ncbi:MAG TPA: Ig-like domain-containing protein, partial [Gemmatimonadales bacterium]|nr:Ig-like domain-containing protein [Gemmatimonadales bacterium]